MEQNKCFLLQEIPAITKRNNFEYKVFINTQKSSFCIQAKNGRQVGHLNFSVNNDVFFVNELSLEDISDLGKGIGSALLDSALNFAKDTLHCKTSHLLLGINPCKVLATKAVNQKKLSPNKYDDFVYGQMDHLYNFYISRGYIFGDGYMSKDFKINKALSLKSV